MGGAPSWTIDPPPPSAEARFRIDSNRFSICPGPGTDNRPRTITRAWPKGPTSNLRPKLLPRQSTIPDREFISEISSRNPRQLCPRSSGIPTAWIPDRPIPAVVVRRRAGPWTLVWALNDDAGPMKLTGLPPMWSRTGQLRPITYFHVPGPPKNPRHLGSTWATAGIGWGAPGGGLSRSCLQTTDQQQTTGPSWPISGLLAARTTAAVADWHRHKSPTPVYRLNIKTTTLLRQNLSFFVEDFPAVTQKSRLEWQTTVGKTLLP